MKRGWLVFTIVFLMSSPVLAGMSDDLRETVTTGRQEMKEDIARETVERNVREALRLQNRSGVEKTVDMFKHDTLRTIQHNQDFVTGECMNFANYFETLANLPPWIRSIEVSKDNAAGSGLGI